MVNIVAKVLILSVYFSPASAVLVSTPTTGERVSVDTAQLFQLESFQLTSESLSNLDSSTAEVFQFDEGQQAENDKLRRSAPGFCRTFPGDSSWPSDAVWKNLKSALGHDALIKTVPLASPCYNGRFYNQATCAALTANWTNSYLQ